MVRKLLGATVLVLVLSAGTAVAQGTTYGLHQKALERINQAENIAPLSIDDAFGDQLSLYNGTVQFVNVDISVPGNFELPVELRRTYQIQERRAINQPLGHAGYLGGFGEWDIDLPPSEGNLRRRHGLAGWPEQLSAAVQHNRCPPGYARVFFIRLLGRIPPARSRRS